MDFAAERLAAEARLVHRVGAAAVQYAPQQQEDAEYRKSLQREQNAPPRPALLSPRPELDITAVVPSRISPILAKYGLPVLPVLPVHKLIKTSAGMCYIGEP